MLIPMYIMAALCVICGTIYPLVSKYLLFPAANASLNVGDYIDKMMGAGYAEAAGVPTMLVEPVTFSFWNPVLWLILFGIVFFAAVIVILLGTNERGKILTAGEKPEAKYATFFSGEEEMFSQVGGSDLFWGFKKNWKGYYKVFTELHSGIVTDYTSYTVIATAIIVMCLFIFMR